jgi:hypothetical protein
MSLLAALGFLKSMGNLPHKVVDRLFNNDLTRKGILLDHQAKQIQNAHAFVRMLRDAEKTLPDAAERRQVTRLFLTDTDSKRKNGKIVGG